MNNITFLLAQCKRELIYFKRYFFNSIGGFLTLYIVFLLLFLGYRGLAGGTEMYGSGLDNLIVGYLLWMLAMMVYQDIAYTLFNEAREGILEQLYMSPYGYIRVTLFRLIGSLIPTLLIVLAILLAMMFSTGRYLNLDLVSLIPLMFLLLLGVVGIGFALGGLQLIFKRIQSYLQIMQFLLVAMVVAPMSLGWTRFLPAAQASHLIREVMVREISLFQLPLFEVLLAVAVGVLYLYLGIVLFRLCERKAMNSGRLSQF